MPAIESLSSGQKVTVKTGLDLNNVDNTSDAGKPISTATQAALDGKAASSHTHSISNVTGLQTALDGKAASSHSHAISDVTDLQTSLDGKAASSHTHSIGNVTGLQTALDGKAASSHMHEISDVSGLQAALDGGSGALTVVSGTNADTTLTVNQHVELDGDLLTANRTYTIPAGTVGDRIRISLTKGNSTHSLIIKANTGVQINRGTLAAEWSRLFIVAEYVELRCTNGTNWDVWDDGRLSEYCELYGVATTAYVQSAYTGFTLGGSDNPHGMGGTNEIRVRRNGKFLVCGFNLFQPTVIERHVNVAYQNNGVAHDQANIIRYGIYKDAGAGGISAPPTIIEHSGTVGNSYGLGYYISTIVSGTNQYYTVSTARPSLLVRRVG